jgi:hypothetical protein
MTAIYLDTEFNGFHGSLISLALYDAAALTGTPEAECCWYEVAEIPANPHPFVAQHVIPVLHKEPIGMEAFTASLREFLNARQDCLIVADWPEDFIHLCARLIAPEGWSINLRCLMELVVTPPGQPIPRIPHNALEDARALAVWHTSS